MRRLWRSTFGLVSIISALLAIATLVIGVAAYSVTHEALEEQLDHRTATETRALLAEPGADRLEALADAIRRRERIASIDHLGYILVDGKGRRIAGSLQADAPVRLGYEEFLHHGEGRVAQSLTTAVPGGGRLVVAADREILGTTDGNLLLLFSIAFGTILLLGVGGAWTVGFITRARLNRIDRAALAIIGGDLQQRMPIDGSDSEFDKVSATLNRMLDRITALMDNLRQVSSDVAHDLRTPLTRLRNRLDEVASADERNRRDAVLAASAQVDELLEMFAALLRISEVEAMGIRQHFRPFSIGHAVSDLIDTYRPDAEAGGHVLVDAVDRGITIHGDRRLLLQMTSNLLDNALRHTPPGTTIQITLERQENDVVLRIADDGPGVGDGDRERLFQRFARLERSRSSEGNGLGLAMVRAIATAHHGEAMIADGPGFTIVVSLRNATAQTKRK